MAEPIEISPPPEGFPEVDVPEDPERARAEFPYHPAKMSGFLLVLPLSGKNGRNSIPRTTTGGGIAAIGV